MWRVELQAQVGGVFGRGGRRCCVARIVAEQVCEGVEAGSSGDGRRAGACREVGGVWEGGVEHAKGRKRGWRCGYVF
ncbi:MAG: hypothetical protein N3A67_07870 [Ignavibacteria bacterium]|nr:hypothetical protein [Ignavibacteria bacterium]